MARILKVRDGQWISGDHKVIIYDSSEDLNIGGTGVLRTENLNHDLVERRGYYKSIGGYIFWLGGESNVHIITENQTGNLDFTRPRGESNLIRFDTGVEIVAFEEQKNNTTLYLSNGAEIDILMEPHRGWSPIGIHYQLGTGEVMTYSELKDYLFASDHDTFVRNTKITFNEPIVVSTPEVSYMTSNVSEYLEDDYIIAIINSGDGLTYQITAGNDDGMFVIDADTGVIILAETWSLDYETTPRYDLMITASDGTITNLFIQVRDIDEELFITYRRVDTDEGVQYRIRGSFGKVTEFEEGADTGISIRIFDADPSDMTWTITGEESNKFEIVHVEHDIFKLKLKDGESLDRDHIISEYHEYRKTFRFHTSEHGVLSFDEYRELGDEYFGNEFRYITITGTDNNSGKSREYTESVQVSQKTLGAAAPGCRTPNRRTSSGGASGITTSDRRITNNYWFGGNLLYFIYFR